ncbi:MAG: autotransporter-associated beta strand repeat-containing protein [Verrucomicrobia bacterium]|nr:autotransporter-associated beta strand repeat-containing protein [Verrucomicrobiota bacterium]
MKPNKTNPLFARFFRGNTLVAAVVLSLGSTLVPDARAGDLYWDANGATAGSGNVGGTWNSGTNWTTDSTGATATVGWTDGENAIFSAGTDGTGAWTATITGSITTPLIKLEEAGAKTITGGTINIGGGTINTAAAGNGVGQVISSIINAPGGLTVSANGDTSETGGGVGGNLLLSGANTISGDVTLKSGVVVSTSNFGGSGNKIILDGGGIVDTGANTVFANPLEVPTGKTGVYRTYGGVTGAQLTGAVTGAGTLMRSDGGTITVNGNFSAFTGTLMNARGTMIIGAAAATTLANIPVIQTDGTNVLRLGASGTTTIKSLTSDRDVVVPFGSRLNIATGTYMATGAGTTYNGFWAQGTTAGTASATGEITSSGGTLTLTNGAATGNLTTTDNQLRLKVVDYDGSTPLAFVKNNRNSLVMDMPNSYTGGTTINGGRIQTNNVSALGTGTVTVNPDGQAFLSAGGTYANNFAITGYGVTEAAGNLGAIRFVNNTISGGINVAGAASIVAYGASGTHTGALTGSANLSLNLAASPGTLNFTGNTVGYTGTMTLNAGTLNIGASGLGGSLVVNGRTGTAGAGVTTNITGNPVSVLGGIAGDLTVNGGTATADGAGAVANVIGGVVTVQGTIGGNVALNAGSSTSLNGGVATGVGGTATLNGTVTGNVTVADGAVLAGEGSIAGTLNLGATAGATLKIKASTAGALAAGTVNLTGTNTVSLETLPLTTGEFTVLSYTTLNSGDENNFDVPDGIFRGNPEVQHDIANSRFTLELDSQARTWNNAQLTGAWNTSDSNWAEGDNVFFSGDDVVFTDTAVGTVSLANGLQPLSITFQNTVGNNYILTGTGGISGSTGISMTGGGNVTLGGANSFSGAISVGSGVLAMGSAGAFGTSSGVTVANGATVDINGQSPGAVATGGYTYTIQGTGVDGSGAIRNTGASVASNAGVKSLVLTGNATVNAVGAGRFDIGFANVAGSGTITGNGYTLTKIGTAGIALRANASATPINIIAEAGDLWAENDNSALGGATGTVTANGTSRIGTYGDRTIATPVTLNAGTSLMNLGGGTGIWTGTITAAGDITVNAGGNMAIDGTLTGTGNIAKTGGSLLVLQSDTTGYSGKVTVNAGALRIENASATGTATGTNVISMANGTTLQGGTITGQATTSFGSATQGITLTGTGDVYFDAGNGYTLSIGSDVVGGANNVATQNGTVVFGGAVSLTDALNVNAEVRARNNSTVSFATGANVNVRQIALGLNGQGNSSNMNIAAGATVTAQRLVTSDGGSTASVINQTGGTFNITGTNNTNSTSASFFLGHWSGSTTYNLSAGTINAGGALLSLGWDAAGGVNFNQSGGTNNILGLNLGNGRTNPATYEVTGGRLNIGSGGVTANASKFLKLGGGTVGASADWSSSQAINLTGTGGNVTIDTLDSVNGTTPRTISLTGNLSGTGGLTKTGAGLLALGGTGTFTGTALVNGGVLHVNGNAAATATLRTAAGGTLRPGTPAAAGTPTAANLTLDGGSADFRIGTSTDKLTVTGTFNVESATAVQAIPLNAISGSFPQTFDVIDYTGTIGGASGFAGLTFASSNPHLSGTLVNDETNTIVKVQINAADSVVWKGNVDGNWDVNATSNWVLGSDGVTSSKYYDFDVVKFDQTGIGTPAVNLVGTITPAALSVENTSGTYVFSGSGIGGGTGLSKTGAGGLMLLNDNTYTGAVSITGGRVDVGNGGATGTLGGSGNVTVDTGATLAFNTTTNQIFGASRLIGGGGAIEKSGSGTLEFQGNHGYTGGTTINGGTVLLSTNGGEVGVISGVVTVNAGGTLSATSGNAFGWGGQRIHTLNLNGGTATTSVNGDQGWGITVNLGDGGTLATSGAGYYSLGGGSSVNYTGTATSATISGTIRLRENNTNGRLPINVADGSAAVDVNVTGPITQAAAGLGISKSGAGTLQLSGDNTFSGPIEITAGTVRVSRPQHSLVPNPLTGTGGVLEHASPQQLVLSGDGSNFGGTIDANGKEVRLAHDTAGAGTGGTLALEGGTLALGLNTPGFLYYGTFAGAAMDTTPLTAGALATSASGLHGGIGGNTTIAYDGEIYLTAGDWSFGENVDDAVYVKVDGNVLINDNQWNVPTTGTFNAPADGWYPITLRVQNGGGGNGPVDAWLTAGIGIGIKQGGGSTNVGDYVKFEIGALGTNCRVYKAAGTNTMAGTLALGGGVANTVDTAGGSLALNGPVTGGASESLVKNGAGTLSLNAVNTYTGDTVVNAGTVAVNGTSIKDTNKVVLDGGMLNLTGTERVTSLFYGALQQADGTYGATGSGATNIDDTRFSGTGVLVVGAPTGYNAWAGTNAPTGGPGDDYDGDGVINAVEYVLGGSAAASDLGKLPTVSASGSDLVFTFVRDQDSKTPDTTVQIEVGTTLAAWPNVYNVGNDTAGSTAGVTVTDNGNGTDTITLTVSKGTDALKFGRLKVTIN